MDWLATCAATLVARDDLDMQAAFAAVSRVEHVGVASIGFDIEDHVAVGPVLLGRPDNNALEGGAGTENLQSLLMLHAVVGISLAGAAPESARLSYRESTPWRASQGARATWKRRGEEKDKDEPQ